MINKEYWEKIAIPMSEAIMAPYNIEDIVDAQPMPTFAYFMRKDVFNTKLESIVQENVDRFKKDLDRLIDETFSVKGADKIKVYIKVYHPPDVFLYDDVVLMAKARGYDYIFWYHKVIEIETGKVIVLAQDQYELCSN